MPWKVATVSERRLSFIDCVNELGLSVSEACRQFGISRKTGYKWLALHRADPSDDLADRSRRPRGCPNQTDPASEALILKVRDQYGWGARKIRAFLMDHSHAMPSLRTVHHVLQRHDRIKSPAPPTPLATQRFERDQPNQLWQMDFKGPLEIGRRRVHPLTIMDDHSRYLLRLTVRDDHTQKAVWDLLWATFGEVGLPDELLCDNEFASRHSVPRSISWFDGQLLRLGIEPIHGRPYHPQTQGKIERLHGTFERELYPRSRRDCIENFHEDAEQWRWIYNTQRPHQAIGDRPPLTRWRPSSRLRPQSLPEPSYSDDMQIRKVGQVGDIRWRKYRILAGRGLVGQPVGIRETEAGIAVFFCHKRIRLVPHDQLKMNSML